MSHTVACVTPTTASWERLRVEVIDLAADETIALDNPTHESAVVVVKGSLDVSVDGLEAVVSRSDVFTEMADLVYAPPRSAVRLTALVPTQIAVGQAPAQGRCPARIVRVAEMVGLVRGGGPARRQVMSALAEPLPAESLIVYEGWVPRGSWTGWPPHRHDGHAGSPVLEETYYYRFDRPSGFGFHRNFAPEDGWEETHLLRDQELVLAPRGYHLCGNGPAANMWLLNFLAGSPEDRARTPYLDPAETWIQRDWTAGQMPLPAVHHPSLLTTTEGVS